MSGNRSIVLDTNAYSALFRGDETVRDAISSARRVILSPVVLGELQAGFALGSKRSKNSTELGAFLAQPTVFVEEIGKKTAEQFAKIFVQLREKGTPIPHNDIWIAAQTMELRAELLTLDRHFGLVEGLRVRQ